LKTTTAIGFNNNPSFGDQDFLKGSIG